MSENNTELIIYQTEDGRTKIDVHMENETVWLSLEQMSELFQRDKSTISRHIKNVFSEGELLEEATVANFATTAADGKTDPVDYYYLSAKRSARVIRVTRSSSVRFLASSFSLQTNCGSLMSASKNSLGVTPR